MVSDSHSLKEFPNLHISNDTILKNNKAKKNHENKEQNSAKAKNLAQYAKEELQKIM
jgi:hypothetical protein